MKNDLAIEEELAKTGLDRAVMRRLAGLLRPVWLVLGAVLLVEIATVCIIILRPWFMRLGIDDGLAPTADGLAVDWQFVLLVGLGLAGCWAVRFTLVGLAAWLSGNMAIAILGDLRQRLAEQVSRLSIRFFDQTKAGRIVSRADSDVERLEALVIYGPPMLVSSLARCVGSALMLLIIAPSVFFYVLPLLPLLLVVVHLFKKFVTRLWSAVTEERSRITANLVESIQGIREIQQAVHEERQRLAYQEKLDRFDGHVVRASFGWAWFPPFTLLLFTLGIGLVLYAASDLVMAERLSLGQLTQCMFYVFLFLGPLQDFGDLFERGSEGVAAAQRIFLLLDTDPEVEDAADAQDLDDCHGEVRYAGVSFAYDPAEREDFVLKDIDLHIPPGQKLAIVGPTGHGKSTMVQLLCRFYDVQQGRISIDGRDIRQVTQASLRRQIGVVLQDNVLFSGTVLDNLRLARYQAGDEELIAACRAVGADHVLERLPNGYRTEVGPQGSLLSHGQRQLVCFVRAYLADPAVLVLDEATSAVDVHTERRLQRALQRLTAGRTAIVIAHRLATIRNADRIIVVHDGRIVESGAHDELMAQGGHYAELYREYQAGERMDDPQPD